MISVFSSSPSVVRNVEQPADLMVGVLEEAREHLHHPGIQLPRRLGRIEASQSGTSRIMA